MDLKVLRLAVVAAIVALAPQGARLAAQEVPFLRGDYNQDGMISVSDAVALKRFMFNGDMPTRCWNTGDIDDSGKVDLTDAIMLFQLTMMIPDWVGTWGIMPPFPEAGLDPTPNADVRLLCESYTVQPAEATNDIIRIGEVEGMPGTEVKIPVYISTSVPVDAVQLVLSYDPAVLDIHEEYDEEEGFMTGPLTWENTYFAENFFGKTFTITSVNLGVPHSYYYSPHNDNGPAMFVGVHPQHKIFTAAFAGHLMYTEFAIQPGDDMLVAWIKATISPDAAPGTAVDIVPVGAPGVGLYSVRCELTHRGAARYASLLPVQIPGRVGVVGDITFFDRGDANVDKQVDLSDAVTILSFLFMGAQPPGCQDAADADANGTLELTDAIVVLNHLFMGGEDPLADEQVACHR